MSHIVVNRTTAKSLRVEYLNNYPISDWIHNPDLSSVKNIKKKYWKVVGETVIEMTQAEKDVVDTDSAPPIYYLIQEDTQVGHDFTAINYKTELLTDISYTPVFTFQVSGEGSGLLETTEYYKDYVDENDMGTLIINVTEEYVIEDAPTLYNSVKSVLSRTKTWKYAKHSDGQLDELNTKVRTKLYNTRKKRHNEAIRRRDNILEQLIDNVGLSGILSGTFTDVTDAHQKLVEIQIAHGTSMDAWISSGHGTIYDDIANDVTITWLDSIVVDTANTQAMVPWMIGMDFRDYIVAKIKGEIQ